MRTGLRERNGEPRLPQDEPIGFKGRTGDTLVCVLDQRIVAISPAHAGGYQVTGNRSFQNVTELPVTNPRSSGFSRSRIAHFVLGQIQINACDSLAVAP
jgi:hypothetical protein